MLCQGALVMPSAPGAVASQATFTAMPHSHNVDIVLPSSRMQRHGLRKCGRTR